MIAEEFVGYDYDLTKTNEPFTDKEIIDLVINKQDETTEEKNDEVDAKIDSRENRESFKRVILYPKSTSS